MERTEWVRSDRCSDGLRRRSNVPLHPQPSRKVQQREGLYFKVPLRVHRNTGAGTRRLRTYQHVHAMRRGFCLEDIQRKHAWRLERCQNVQTRMGCLWVGSSRTKWVRHHQHETPVHRIDSEEQMEGRLAMWPELQTGGRQ